MGSLGHLDPLQPYSLQAVIHKPQSLGPKPQVGAPDPKMAPNIISPKNGNKDPRTQNSSRTMHWPLANLGLWQSPEEIKSSSARFPLHSGEGLLSTNVLHTMDLIMVHIRYNIPLCTYFSQQSNGDCFRTRLGHHKQSLKVHHPF
ncbi:hypothetical protein O181_106808 [Austropuccinia psidii MF-1]|uniref:Uncharacterized protein n=1 Tax=Austropuccinia psidii MF-1 TaxID=1389203 RepID=A0A9Q3PMA6_9BASI|nr:hypothetical protein [Austropuccinia psidii MF-1]